jgi:hypothetical protein
MIGGCVLLASILCSRTSQLMWVGSQLNVHEP